MNMDPRCLARTYPAGMCSSRGLCGENNRRNRSSSSGGNGSGAHYALCALGVGLIALGIVMIVWTVMPLDGEASGGSSTASWQLHNTKWGVPDPTTFNVPSYEEVVGSADYPVRQSNLRNSISQLPSYEDIIAAVENEGTEPANNPTEETPLSEPAPAPDQPAAEPQADPPALTPNPSLPTRSASRASRLLRPLRVRRIKSDKLHLKDFRLQIRSPTQNPVTIEPITPPPQYDNKMPELG
ncbi:Transmembrane protein 51 [Nibea albiflora]|uniref:Transmembrane protein 51 n=1 Tax=Nibea albiflora TaxID=240163 RepID=A0ACB7F0J1_NIBAL|nr:Transmembrane protein 51 [Nibea albiflora]